MIVVVPTGLLTGGMAGEHFQFENDNATDCQGVDDADSDVVRLTTNLTGCGNRSRGIVIRSNTYTSWCLICQWRSQDLLTGGGGGKARERSDRVGGRVWELRGGDFENSCKKKNQIKMAFLLLLSCPSSPNLVICLARLLHSGEPSH